MHAMIICIFIITACLFYALLAIFNSNQKASIAIVAIAVLSITLPTYIRLGAPRQLHEWYVHQDNAILIANILDRVKRKVLTSDDAISQLQAMTSVSPHDLFATYILANLYLATEQGNAAVTLLSRAHQRMPHDVSIARSLAVALLSTGQQPKQLMHLLDKLSSQQENDSTVHMLRAMAYYKQGQYAAAITQWRILQAQLSHTDQHYLALQKLIDDASNKAQQ